MNENERIKILRVTLKLNQTEFGARIGVKTSTVSSLERGVNAISPQVRKSICREFNVSETWLSTGEGEMFTPEPRDELDALLEAYSLPRFLRGLFQRYAKLPEVAQREVERMILEWAAEISAQPSEWTEHEETPEERHERHKREARAEADELYEVILKEKMEQEDPDTTFGSNSYGGGVA